VYLFQISEIDVQKNLIEADHTQISLEIENYKTNDLLNKGIAFIQDRVKQIDLILGKYQKNIGAFIGGLAAVTSDNQ
jgi:hypothetical protein